MARKLKLECFLIDPSLLCETWSQTFNMNNTSLQPRMQLLMWFWCFFHRSCQRCWIFKRTIFSLHRVWSGNCSANTTAMPERTWLRSFEIYCGTLRSSRNDQARKSLRNSQPDLEALNYIAHHGSTVHSFQKLWSIFQNLHANVFYLTSSVCDLYKSLVEEFVRIRNASEKIKGANDKAIAFLEGLAAQERTSPFLNCDWQTTKFGIHPFQVKFASGRPGQSLDDSMCKRLSRTHAC